MGVADEVIVGVADGVIMGGAEELPVGMKMAVMVVGAVSLKTMLLWCHVTIAPMEIHLQDAKFRFKPYKVLYYCPDNGYYCQLQTSCQCD